ncbi:MAG: sigma-70 family RNA polymerase sigma factor [Acidovorax sp.]
MRPSLPLAAFSEHYHALIAFVARRIGSRQTAQDLVHDAWLRLAEHAGPAHAPQAPQMPQMPAPRAYLYTVAEHLAIDHLRHRQRTGERFDAEAHEHEGMAHDVADACCHREALAAVDAALAALPERCRAVFLADRLDGLPQAEIAARHGISVKTVERDVMRAMDAVEAALRRWRGDADTPPRTGRRRALSALLGVVGVGAGGATAWRLWREYVPAWQADLATATGRQLTQPLPDGGSIALDARTRLAVRYYGARRHVRLFAGTAFFSVARDVDRPFVVDAAHARITVLGTRFEVAIADDGALRVAVEEGYVRVQPLAGEGNAYELTAHEALHWPPGGPPRREAEPGDVAAWRDGWLDFRHEPLGEAVRRIARYSTQPLRVAPDAAQLPVFGRVRIADAQAWLRLLPRSLPVAVREEGRGAQRGIVIARR